MLLLGALALAPGAFAQAQQNVTDAAAAAAEIVESPAARSGLQASAQDLSLFGVLALGIIGLLWVRRHTSEL